MQQINIAALQPSDKGTWVTRTDVGTYLNLTRLDVVNLWLQVWKRFIPWSSIKV